ncbi:hypothetical protein TW85_03450 [Marinomonas sp. S3726]|uniref:hypothetical protein n=1 Tax=Marinomonas sp. S3726 TaxID=579484 RepID=UPI0005FA78FC|nr:hypothetical protein [Marinomonas sp. S3726]KJZ15951.1 hypothetical protein TW85_03450 [Marinomonas sp. S3726]
MRNDQVLITKLKVIQVEGGDVKHAFKSSEDSFKGFGEAYFSSIKAGHIKGWKRHTKMTCNLIVPIGTVKFVVGTEESGFKHFVIGEGNHCRISIPPDYWFAFKGVSDVDSLILNISDIEHSETESIKCDLDTFKYNWEN